MRRRTGSSWHWIFLALLLTVGAAKSDPTTIDNLGELDAISYKVAISGDGEVVTWREEAPAGKRWTEAGGAVTIAPIGGIVATPETLSHDGSVVVGKSSNGSWPNGEAFRWEGSTVGLGDLRVPGHHSSATGISDDGTRISGWGTSPISTGAKLPALWTSETGLVAITGFTGGVDLLLDSSGLWVAGQASGVAAYTSCPTPSTCASVTSIGDLPGGAASSAPVAVTTRGGQILIAGTGTDAAGSMAFRWSSSGGFVSLGGFGGTSFAREMTPDGRLIVGTASNKAFVWDKVSGMRDLQDLLENDYGLDLSAWSLIAATGVSDDTRRIVGYGNGPGPGFRVFLVTLDEPLLPPRRVPSLSPLGLATFAAFVVLVGSGAILTSRRRVERAPSRRA